MWIYDSKVYLRPAPVLRRSWNSPEFALLEKARHSWSRAVQCLQSSPNFSDSSEEDLSRQLQKRIPAQSLVRLLAIRLDVRFEVAALLR